jgi:cytosine/adenosine deaminase-related metal-dependent hydrolase
VNISPGTLETTSTESDGLTHRDVLEFATIEGARTCGLDAKVGSLAPGKQADLILLRTDRVNVAPMIDPVTTTVVFADTSNVDSVFVAGKAVKRDGELVGHDLDRVLGLLEESRDYLLSRAGMLPDWAAAAGDRLAAVRART